MDIITEILEELNTYDQTQEAQDMIKNMLDSPTHEWVAVGCNAAGEVQEFYVGCCDTPAEVEIFAKQKIGFYEIIGIRSYVGTADTCSYAYM